MTFRWLTASAGIDEDLLYTFNLQEQYATASYRNYNNEHPDEELQLDCEFLANSGSTNQVDMCPWVEKESQKTLYQFRQSAPFDILNA